MLTARYLATRSTKTTHELTDQNHASSDRAAKRRRTQTPQNDASTIINLTHAESVPSHALHASEQPTSDDSDASLRELRTHPQHDGPSFEDGAASAEAFGQLDPGMTKAISDIIDHSERFEQYCAMGAANEERSSGSKSLVFAKTGSRMKVESLPILDNLVTAIP